MIGVCSLVTDLITKRVHLQLISLFFLISGLLIDIIGVLIILSADYQKVRDKIRHIVKFSRESNIQELRQEINQKKLELRKNSDFITKDQAENFELSRKKGRQLLVDIIFSDRKQEIHIKEMRFISKSRDPKLKDIILSIDTNICDNLHIEDKELEIWSDRSVNRIYYRYGGLFVLFGFVLLLISAIVELASLIFLRM